MPNFSYQAINERGSVVTGIIEADSARIAEDIIASRGHTPWKIKRARDSSSSGFFSAVQSSLGVVKTKDLILFTKQLRSMLNAGIPMIRLLKVIELQTQNRTLRKIARTLTQDVRKGLSLFECMEKHPSVFSPLYRSMVRAGEISGTVPEVLKRLIYIIEHEEKVRSSIKAAFRYPVIVILFLGIAFFILLTFVIPKFAVMFERAGVALPLPTRLAVGLYDLMHNYWYIVIGIMAVLIAGLVYSLKSEDARYTRDSFFLKIPVFGPLFTKAAMSRFASIFAILHGSGVSVLNSMSILAETIGNAAIGRTFNSIRDRVKEGQGLAEPLKSAKYFTPMVIDMVAIGEETGNLEEMLQEVSKHYDDEVEFALSRLSEYIGPVLIVGLASVVGFFALAIFLPMWDMIHVQSKF